MIYTDVYTYAAGTEPDVTINNIDNYQLFLKRLVELNFST